VKRLAELADRHRLPPEAPERLALLLALVRDEPSAITTVRDPARAADVHVADSLEGLDAVRGGSSVADLGSGGGFPGLVLAIAAPASRFALVESVRRKCDFLRRAAAELGLANTEVVCGRAELLAPGRFHVVTARALADLPVVLEYAAPVLAPDGIVLAWKGRRDPREAADGAAAAAQLGLGEPSWRRVQPYPGVERHLVAARKVAPTPPAFPRRPGMARKRPLRAENR
jgi:16S rRNA (guanine527-N7)-methyltransferase